MKLLVLYRPNSEFSRGVEEFVAGLEQDHGVEQRQVTLLDYDSRDGSATASMYDIMAQPTILVTNDDGSYVKDWQGAELPRLDEVVGYLYSMQ